MRWMRRGLVVGSVAWAAALPLATFAASPAHPTSSAYVFALVVYAVGGVVCHQLEARSFHLWGHQLPVCARCTGIYAGAAIAGVMALTRARRSVSRMQGAAPAVIPSPAWTLIIAATPIVASLVYEWTTGITPSNSVRAATGIVLGLAVGWILVSGLGEPREGPTL